MKANLYFVFICVCCGLHKIMIPSLSQGDDYPSLSQGGDYPTLSQGGDFPSPKSPSDLLSYCTKTSDTNKWACAVCGQFSHSRRYLVRNHVESKHFPASFEYHCEICHKICNTKKGLEVHIFERHRSYKATI